MATRPALTHLQDVLVLQVLRRGVEDGRSPARRLEPGVQGRQVLIIAARAAHEDRLAGEVVEV